jgi:hypothetical protein
VSVVVSVRSIDALLAEDPGALDTAELKANLLEFARARARLDAAEAATIAVFDERAGFVADGMLNTRAWLAHHTGIARAAAGSRVLMAKRLRRMPLLFDALAAGEVTEAHVRAMGRCLTPRTLEAFARDEALLVGHAKDLEADDFEVVVSEWLRLNDLNGPDPRDPDPSELRTSPILDGRHRLDGELDLEDSAEFLAELEALYDELWHQDQAADDSDPAKHRSHAQRNAAALIEMARRSSAAGDRDNDPDETRPGPTPHSPRRPLLLAVVDILALQADRDGAAQLDDGTTLTKEMLERWACYSAWARIVMAGPSIPFDLGKVTYSPSPGQRRALTARDKGCIVPGCKRKARWCEPHHVTPWPQGPTDLRNLALLCKRHHQQVHRKIIQLLPGDTQGRWIVVRASDGTPLRERPPPRLAA